MRVSPDRQMSLQAAVAPRITTMVWELLLGMREIRSVLALDGPTAMQEPERCGTP